MDSIDSRTERAYRESVAVRLVRIVAAYAARRIPAGVQVDERVRDSRVLGSRAWQNAGGLNFVPVF